MDPRLFEAARRGDMGALNALFVDDPFILERNALARNPENCLHVATFAKKVDFVKEVVRLKPELAWKLNRDGFSPIHLAAANGSADIVRVLLSSNRELGRLNSSDGRTALHCATITGSVDVVREVVKACPESISDVTVEGETAVHLAVKNSQLGVFRLVVKMMVETDKKLINAKDKDGNTVLHLATARKQHQIMELLLSNRIPIEKVEVNITNNNGFTALDVLDDLQQTVIEPGDNYLRQLLQSAGARSQDLSLGRPSTNVSPSPLVDNKPAPADAMLSLLCDPKKLWRVLVQNIIFPFRLWMDLTKEAENIPPEKQNALMVVAVLIADLTYNAVLNPPGGYKQSDDEYGYPHQHNNGMANMASDYLMFTIIAALNSIAFLSALTMIFLITARFPFKALFRLLLFAMASTYVCAFLYISPLGINIIYIATIGMALAVLLQLVLGGTWYLGKKWWSSHGINLCPCLRR